MSKAKRSIQKEDTKIEEVKKQQEKKSKKGGIKEKVEKSENTALYLIIITILCAVSIYFATILFVPAFELFSSEFQQLEANREAGDYIEGEQGTQEQADKRDHSEAVQNQYNDIRKKYATDSNQHVRNFSNIHSAFFRILIILLIIFFGTILPVVFLIANIKELLYAILFIFFYFPYTKILKKVFNILTSDTKKEKKHKVKESLESKHSKNKKTSSKHSLETA